MPSRRGLEKIVPRHAISGRGIRRIRLCCAEPIAASGAPMTDLTRIENAFLTVDVSPLGAEMQAIATPDGRNWLWNGDAAFWSGRSPVLFPIVGKAPDDTLLIDGKPYPMGQHGFARRR